MAGSVTLWSHKKTTELSTKGEKPTRKLHIRFFLGVRSKGSEWVGSQRAGLDGVGSCVKYRQQAFATRAWQTVCEEFQKMETSEENWS